MIFQAFLILIAAFIVGIFVASNVGLRRVFVEYRLDALAIVICALAYLRSVDLRFLLLGWDIDGSVLNASLAFQRTLSAWAPNQGLGVSNAASLAQMGTRGVEAALEWLRISPSNVEWIMFGVTFLMIPIAMTAYVRQVFPGKNTLRFIAAIAFAFNFYVAITWYTPTLVFAIAIACAPLMSAAIIAFAKRRNVANALWLIFASFYCSDVGSNSVVFVVAFATTCLLLIFGCGAAGLPRKALLIPAVLALALQSFWLVPTVEFVISANAQISAGDYATDWGEGALQATSGSASPGNVVRLIGTWDWEHSDAAGHRYIAYAPWYETNLFLLAFSFVLPILALAAIILKGQRAPFLFWALLVTLFMIKGTAAPFGGLYEWAFHHVPLFNGFRNPYSNFGIAAAPLLALLAGIGASAVAARMKGAQRPAFVAGLSVAILISIWPYWAAQMFRHNEYSPSYYVTMPPSYNALADFLNAQPDQSSRAMILPFSPQLSYTAFTWGFNGPDPLPFLLRRPTFTETRSWAGPSVHLALQDAMSSVVRLRQVVRDNDIEYAIVHRDIDTSFYNAEAAPNVERLIRAAGGLPFSVAAFNKDIGLYYFPTKGKFASIASLRNSSYELQSVSPQFMASLVPVRTYTAVDGATSIRCHTLCQYGLVPLPMDAQLSLARTEEQLVPRGLQKAAGGLAILQRQWRPIYPWDASSPILRGPIRGLLADGLPISTSAIGIVTSGEHSLLMLQGVPESGSRWESAVIHDADGAISTVESIPLVLARGEHAYGVHYSGFRADSPVTLKIQCCAPIGSQKTIDLAPSVTIEGDGNPGTAVMFAQAGGWLPARVVAEGPGAAKFPRDSKLSVSTQIIDSAIYPRASLVTIPTTGKLPPGVVRIGEHVSSGSLRSFLQEVNDVTGVSIPEESLAATPGEVVSLSLPLTLRLTRNQSQMSLAPTSLGGGSIAIGSVSSSAEHVTIDSFPVHVGQSITLDSGEHRIIFAKPSEVFPSTPTPSQRAINLPFRLPLAGRWIVKCRYAVANANFGAALHVAGMTGSDVFDTDNVTIVADGHVHEFAFFVKEDRPLSGFLQIYGAGIGTGRFSTLSVSLARVADVRYVDFPSNMMGRLLAKQDNSPQIVVNQPLTDAAFSEPRELHLAPEPLPVEPSDTMSIHVPRPGILVLSIGFYPGWQARDVNGRTLERVLVDGVYNGWIIPSAGDVFIRFAPLDFLRFGRLLTLLALLSLIILSILPFFRSIVAKDDV